MIGFAYRIRWRPRARKDLERLPKRDRIRVIESIERFAVSSEGDVRKLSGITPTEYRLRVGPYRVRFTRDEEQRILTILRILPRDKAYRVREPEIEFSSSESFEAVH